MSVCDKIQSIVQGQRKLLLINLVERDIKGNPTGKEVDPSVATQIQAALPTSDGKFLVKKLTTTAKAEVFTVQAIADVGGNLGGKYFLFNTPERAYYVWLDVDNGNTDPAVDGRIGVEVDISSGDTANTIAAAIQVALDALTEDRDWETSNQT